MVVQEDDGGEDYEYHFTMGDSGDPDKVPWVPLTLSLVEYPKGDWLGLLLAMSSFAPMTLHTSFIAVLFFRRDLWTIFFHIGFLLNEPLNQFIKHTVKQPRPISDRSQFGVYGMPSSHSQHMWFFSTFSILFLIVRVPEGSPAESCGMILILAGVAAVVGFGRVYLQYHTWTQVVVGGTVGGVAGGLWFALTHLILTPWFPTIVSWSISQYLLVRDTTDIKHLLWFEYNNTINYEKGLYSLPS